MKLPIKLLAIVVFALAMTFASFAGPDAPADGDRVASVQTVDSSGTVKATSVDVNIVAAECPITVPRTRGSVGKLILNATRIKFESVVELEGYKTVIDRPTKIAHYAGFANTRAREQV